MEGELSEEPGSMHIPGSFDEVAASDLPTEEESRTSIAKDQRNGKDYKSTNDYSESRDVYRKDEPEPVAEVEREPEVKLSKKDVQLLGYAVAELYYDREYVRVIDLCRRVGRLCEVDAKVREILSRWIQRCEGRSGNG